MVLGRHEEWSGGHVERSLSCLMGLHMSLSLGVVVDDGSDGGRGGLPHVDGSKRLLLHWH